MLTEYYDCQSRNLQMPHPERLHKVKLSMKRLKGVLSERKMEYEKLQEKGKIEEGQVIKLPEFDD